jgi:hypothetical protein
VNFRTQRISYKSKKIKNNKPEDWVIFHDTHPAIVSRDTFAKAQAIISQNKKIYSEHKEYPISPFRDVVFCADCGKRMYIMHKNGKHINSDSFVCSTYRKSAKHCSSHYIKETDLLLLVTENIDSFMRYCRMDETALRNNLIKLLKSRNSEDYMLAEERLEEIEKRLNEIPDVRKKLFEEKIDGSVSQKIFADIMVSLDEEDEVLKKERDSKLILVNSRKDSLKGVDLFLNRLNRYRTSENLSKDMIDELIERIEIYEPDNVNAKPLKKAKIVIFYVGVGRIDGIL